MALDSKPDIVTIMIGTNDAYEDNWDERQFRVDFKEMVSRIK